MTVHTFLVGDVADVGVYIPERACVRDSWIGWRAVGRVRRLPKERQIGNNSRDSDRGHYAEAHGPSRKPPPRPAWGWIVSAMLGHVTPACG